MPRHSPYALISLTYGFWNFQFELSELSFLFNVPVNFPVTFNFKKDLILLIAFALDIQIIYLYSIQLSKFIERIDLSKINSIMRIF